MTCNRDADMARVLRVQELRRSNAATPIPGKRGLTDDQAILEQVDELVDETDDVVVESAVCATPRSRQAHWG